MDRAVARRHRRQPEPLRVLGGDRHADQPAAELREEVDLVGGYEIRREDEIALVLAILVIDQDRDAPGLELGDDVGDRR